MWSSKYIHAFTENVSYEELMHFSSSGIKGKAKRKADDLMTRIQVSLSNVIAKWLL